MSTDTQTIKDRVDIAQLIGEYVQLKKAGANWKACCPFHHEKSPSFMVHPEKQIWHCFGCGKGGDIFSFLQEIEGLDFPEALKLLADRAGVKIDSYRSEVDKSQRNRIVEINAKAAYFFHRFLLDISGANSARQYLQKRGLSASAIEDWQVGYIPDQWDLLTKYLQKKGFAIDDIVASGLTIKKEGASGSRGYYDRFRGRIMFPIWDVHNNVVGFTGRILVEKENSGGKYVNTPQTLVYDKSRVLYGLNKAKTEIKTKDNTVVVEGQMDVIACHQAGMKNVVASSGTALTGEQIKLLKRYSSNVAMAFDADIAGQEASKRGIAIALQEGLRVRVIRIPENAGKDADECLKKNPAVWFSAVEKSQDVMEWYFEGVLSGINKRDSTQKQKAAEILLAEIGHVPYTVERDEWLKRLGDELGIDVVVLRETQKKMEKGLVAPKTMVQPSPSTKTFLVSNRMEKLQTAFWSLLTKYSAVFASRRADIDSRYFVGSPFAVLYETVEKQYNDKGTIDLESVNIVSESIPPNFLIILMLAADKDYGNIGLPVAEKEAKSLLEQIKLEWLKNKRMDMQTQLASAEKIGDKESAVKLINEMNSL